MDKNKLTAVFAFVLAFGSMIAISVTEPWTFPGIVALIVLTEVLLKLYEVLHRLDEIQQKMNEDDPPRHRTKGPIDIGIIVALEEEFEELHKQLLSSYTPVKDDVTGTYDYLFTRSVDGAVPYRCAATLVGEMGMTDAALAAERFLDRRRPRTIVMLGIAAGIHKDVKLGDVIVAKSVGRYIERAKVVNGVDGVFNIRPGGDAFPCSPNLVRSAQNLRFAHASIYQRWQEAGRTDLAKAVPDWETLREKDWLAAAPAFVAGAIASGSLVAAAESFVAWVGSTNRNYLGLEMESGGVLAAVYDADPTRSLILRGVSDFGDGRKKELDALGVGGLRRYAMRNAIRLLWSLLEARELPRAE